MASSSRLRWKKHEKVTGLARVCAGPHGSDYTDGTTKYATIQAHRDWGKDVKKGWFFYASVEGVKINTCDTDFPTESEAKAAASAWVKEQLKAGVK